MKLVIFFFITSVSISFAQLSVSVSGGFDPKEISLYDQTASDGVNAYWNNGITFGVNIDYYFSEKVHVSGLFQFSHYSFDKYVDSGFRIPESSFISAEGENSKLWRTSFDIKYFPFPLSRFKFFVLSGLGVLKEDLGTITTRHYNMMGDRQVTHALDSEVKSIFVHSLGMGVRTNIFPTLFIDISGLYYSNYNERFQTFIGISLGYRVI